MPLLGQVWRSISVLSRTALQQGLLFKAPPAACATMLIAGASIYVTVVYALCDRGWRKKQSLPRAATLQKQLLLILQLAKFCQVASLGLESTWSFSLSVFSSSLWPMTLSSINSTSLKAKTLQPACRSTCNVLRKEVSWTREMLKGHVWKVSSR